MASCTFMEIAKKHGVDYGDVLLATEAFRPTNYILSLTSIRLIYEACRRLDLSTPDNALHFEIEAACSELWGE